MRDDYARIVTDICGDRWASLDSPTDERDGGYGVAMVLAHLNGVRASLNEFSTFLRVPPFVLETSYKRLQLNGIFSPQSFVRGDPLLRGESSDDYEDAMACHRAWCHIAGLASGYTGKAFTRTEMTVRSGSK